MTKRQETGNANTKFGKLTHKYKSALAAIAASLMLMTVPAVAGTTVSASLNIRTGPGTDFRVVDVLSRGEHVEVHDCHRGWCRISHHGPDGWVSARYLSNAPRTHIIIISTPTYHVRSRDYRPNYFHRKSVVSAPTFNFYFNYNN